MKEYKKDEEDEVSPCISGVLLGMIVGAVGAFYGVSSQASWMCPAQVPDSNSPTQCSQSCPSNQVSDSNNSTQSYPSNQGNQEGLRNLKTYLYKCETWESDATLFSAGGSPTDIDPEVFGLMTNGTEPAATSTYGYTLNYQPYPEHREKELSMKDIVLLGKNATRDWEEATLVMERSSCYVFPDVVCQRSS
ncbi:hypothetical protein F4782DRAFT_504548 [Xylaria castorea]|nr:hypothetical protein F4782DRAFT_504548 [Xylaria castorea]